MDSAALQPAVEEAVHSMVDAREPFTTACISNPLIADHPEVRHIEVRAIIDGMIAAGDLDQPPQYMIGSTTVYTTRSPNGIQVRLFHPDDPNFDPSTFTANRRVLVRNNVPVTSGFASVDDDGDDGTGDSVPVVTCTPTGAPVTRQCQVQKQHTTVNVPCQLVRAAGFNAGDEISIGMSASTLTIKKAAGLDVSKQSVDAEGRIRVHGKNVESLGKAPTDLCTALVVQPSGGDAYIQIQ